MNFGFRTIYAVALLSTLMPTFVLGQHHPQHDQESKHNQENVPDLVAHFFGPEEFAPEESHTKVIDLKKFEENLPKDSAKVLPYLFELLNDDRNRTAPLFELVESKSAEPEFNIKIQDKELVHEVKVNSALLKNPIYLLEVLTMIDHYMGTGPQTKQSQLSSYKDYHGYWHPETHNWIINYHKYTTHHYHKDIYHTLTASLGITSKAASDNALNSFGGMVEVELRSNAKQGSVYAQYQILRQKQQDIDSLSDNFRNFKFLKNLTEIEKKNYILQLADLNGIKLNSDLNSDELAAGLFKAKKDKFRGQLIALDKKARGAYSKERKYLDNSEKKQEKDRLEKLPQKLNDMVLRNDRQGVANLLETYLPLEIMEPVEKNIWTEWIEAIRNPDKANSYVIYRGLDKENDKFQRLTTPEGEKRIGLFSVLLNKNQGSFTRRLRSLTTMRYKIMKTVFWNGQEVATSTSPLQSTPLMSVMMRRHSGDPAGSPLMSFSINPRVARSFAISGIVAVNIDKRRVLPNIVSKFANELEMLVPLVVFPDEVVAVRESGPSGDIGEEIYKNFKKEVDTIIQRDGLKTYPEKDYEVLKDAFDIFAKATSISEKFMCRQIFN